MQRYKCRICNKIAKPDLFKHMIREHTEDFFETLFPNDKDAINKRDIIEATYDQMDEYRKERL
jgi:hypothetical protein